MHSTRCSQNITHKTTEMQVVAEGTSSLARYAKKDHLITHGQRKLTRKNDCTAKIDSILLVPAYKTRENYPATHLEKSTRNKINNSQILEDT